MWGRVAPAQACPPLFCWLALIHKEDLALHVDTPLLCLSSVHTLTDSCPLLTPGKGLGVCPWQYGSPSGEQPREEAHAGLEVGSGPTG